MTLQSSGAISMSQINTELGRSATAQISLDTAENGGYAAINTASTNRPSSGNPASMSEWYGYNHNAASDPTLNSASQSTTQYPDCGINWTISISWNTSNPMDSTHKIRIRYYGGGSVIADDLTTSSSSYSHDTGTSGVYGQQVNYTTYRYTVELVRKSDSAVIASADTAGESIYHGYAC